MFRGANNNRMSKQNARNLYPAPHFPMYTHTGNANEIHPSGIHHLSQYKKEVDMFEQLVDKPSISVSRKHARTERVGDSAFYTYTKRFLDIGITLIALLFLLPLMIVIGLLVKLDSPGSALFIQKRVGCKRKVVNGEVKWEITTFPMFKFRSMKQNADQSLHQAHIKAYAQGSLNGNAADNAQFKLNGDPRITRLGKFLRMTSLDELPQLLNILRGEMSLVGPRPVPEYEVAYYEPHHFERLEALPGMTGLWQVEGRGRATFEEMMQMDIEYVRTRNLGLDIKLLFATVPAAIKGEGAK
ncbi:MAG: sugar transferase [Caldilineaceae bacterium]